MITAIYISCLVALLVAPIPLIAWWSRRQKQRAADKLRQRFLAFGVQHRLNFSSQELLSDCMIGIDGQQRKLLVVENYDNDVFRSVLIDLHDIRSCEVIHQYPANRTASRSLKPSSILLQLALASRQPVEITFYGEVRDRGGKWQLLDTKARQWEILLSKMQMQSARA